MASRFSLISYAKIIKYVIVFIAINSASQVALVVKTLPVNAGDLGDSDLIPGSEDLEKGTTTPSSIFCQENPMDREAWWAIVHRVEKRWTWLKWLSIHVCIAINDFKKSFKHGEAVLLKERIL